MTPRLAQTYLHIVRFWEAAQIVLQYPTLHWKLMRWKRLLLTILCFGNIFGSPSLWLEIKFIDEMSSRWTDVPFLHYVVWPLIWHLIFLIFLFFLFFLFFLLVRSLHYTFHCLSKGFLSSKVWMVYLCILVLLIT